MKTLVEKYRPLSIENVFLEEKNMNCIRSFIDKQNFPNLLFYGPPGTGKTSTIIAMANDIYKEKYNLMVLELNASDNRNIQVVRKIIKEFASSKTLFNSGYKLIILDEVDSMTNDAQFCLRRIMETYCNNVRFCFICNFIGKIIPAIQSRCSKFKFSNLNTIQISSKLAEIMNEENITISPNIMSIIVNYCNGDMRKILNYIQLFKYHLCNQNPDYYYSLLRIPNIEYIDMVFNKLKTNDAYSFFITGLNLGYYDIETFSQTLYKILVEKLNKNEISEIEFINLVSKLVIIDRNPKKITNFHAFIDYLSNQCDYS